MNTKWNEVLKRFGFDIENNSSWFSAGDNSTLFDKPDMASKVCNKLANAIMKDLVNDSEQYFGSQCIEFASKLEF